VGGVFGVFFQIVKKISENGQINVQFLKKIFQFEKKFRIWIKVFVNPSAIFQYHTCNAVFARTLLDVCSQYYFYI
jgi:hypothetical protein